MKQGTDNQISEANFRNYSDAKAVHYWSTYSEELLTAEKVILQRIRGQIQGKKILDLGVGGGRTTPALLDISQDYIGMDYSSGMVEACRIKFPGIQFIQGDARQISSLFNDQFSLVLFSLNGIDYVAHQDRQKIYSEVAKVLQPGAFFLFSSHNLRDYPNKPWQKWHIDRNSFTSPARNLYHTLKSTLTYIRHYRNQAIHDGHAMLLDPGQGYRLLSYYIDPREQIAQLDPFGFHDVKVFDRWGNEVNAGSVELDHVNPVHYLAKLNT